MANRILNKTESELAKALLADIRKQIDSLAGGDPDLRFAYNRKISKMLVYDERSGPSARRKLKAAKRLAQGGLCAICEQTLPDTYAVIDRLHAADGYTMENTRLICEPCDRSVQAGRAYA